MSALATTTRFTYRFVTGAELDGVKRTNATWRRPGRNLEPGVHRALPWHYLPRGQRAMWRCGVTGLTVLLAVCGWYEPAQTWLAIQGLGVVGLLVLAHWSWTRLQELENRHRYVGPLAQVLASRWGVTPPGDPTKWVTVPVDCRTNADHPVEIIMPADYKESDRQQEASAKLVARKVRIPVTAMDYELDLVGDHPKMLVRAMEVPPEEFTFEDAKPYLEQATDDRLLLGMGLRNTPVWIDWALDSPHLALSFGSGAGKSTVVRLLAAQVLRQGGRVVIFDHAKEGDSHGDWVYDSHGDLLPGVEFYTDTASAHEGLISLGDERARRSRAAHQAKRFGREAPQYPRTLMVFEEMNTGTPMLHDHWRVIRTPEEPVRSPAVGALSALVCAGRSVRMNGVAVAQRFDAKVIGGGDVRASFMLRALARFDEQARRMLIPEISPKPRSSNHPGRTILAVAGEATTLQAAYLTSDETRDWALSGYQVVLEHVSLSDPGQDALVTARSFDQQERASEVGTRTHLQLVTPPVTPVPEDLAPRTVTITEALAEKIVSGTDASVRRAAGREGFPEVRGRKGSALTYFEHELAEWEERRARKTAMSGGR